jgi:hypothetical protein
MARKQTKTTKTRKTSAEKNAALATAGKAAPRGRKAKTSANVTEHALTKDEIAARLAHFAGDRAAYERLAQANGIKLNPSLDAGRTAMVTRNSIRARALKGERVVWTF